MKSPVESFYLPVTHSVIARRAGPLNSQYLTCLIENEDIKAEP